jgi:hypothetical protein
MDDLLGSLVWGSKKRTILCVIGVGVTNGIRAIAQPKMWGNVHKPMKVTSRCLLGCQKWVNPMRVTSGDAGS